ncbi:hypothetical protein ACFV08_14570, partial [Streptomyces fradiae]
VPGRGGAGLAERAGPRAGAGAAPGAGPYGWAGVVVVRMVEAAPARGVTLGVEEEFLLVGADDGAPAGGGRDVVDADRARGGPGRGGGRPRGRGGPGGV